MKTGLPSCAAAVVAIALASCGSFDEAPPAPGLASLDLAPRAADRNHGPIRHPANLRNIGLVAVNGQAARGTRASLQPGKTTARVGFDWPQGGRQEVDLRFLAKPGRLYHVQYEAYPPQAKPLSEPTKWDNKFASDVDGFSDLCSGSDPRPGVLLVPAVLCYKALSVTQRLTDQSQERPRPTEYVDLLVVATSDPDGVVRRVRAYPDGRVDIESWAAYSNLPPR